MGPGKNLEADGTVYVSMEMKRIVNCGKQRFWRLLNLKTAILGEAPDREDEDAEEDANKNEEAYATQLLDDKSLALVLWILRDHYVGKGTPRLPTPCKFVHRTIVSSERCE